MNPDAGINISNYLRKKQKGLVSAIRAGSAYVLTVRRYDENGDEADPTPVVVNMERLESAKAALLKQVEGIDSLIADLEAIPKDDPE